MTANRIVAYDMDVHAEPIAEHAARHPQHPIDTYAAVGGMRPGMIPGPKTDLPIPEPDLQETLVDAAKLGMIVVAGVMGLIALTAAGLAIYLAVTGQLS